MNIIIWSAKKDGLNYAKLENGKEFYTDQTLEETKYQATCFYECPAWEIDNPNHIQHHRYDSRIEKLALTQKEKDKLINIFGVKKGEVFLDLGAYYGFSPIRASERVGESGCVIGIESSEESFNIFKKNIIANGITNIIPINKTLWSEETTLIRYDSPGRIKSVIPNWIKHEKQIEVHTTTIDKILDEHKIPHVDIIVTDINGADLDALMGAQRLLKQDRLRIIVDCYKVNILQKTDEYLKRYGFKTYYGKTYKMYAYKGY